MTARLPDEVEAYFNRCMAVWCDWMHGKDSRRLGVPSRDSVCGNSLTNYSAAEDDSDIVYDLADAELARRVNDACVESLIPRERLAVLMHYGFSRQMWPFHVAQVVALTEGMAELRLLVRKRC